MDFSFYYPRIDWVLDLARKCLIKNKYVSMESFIFEKDGTITNNIDMSNFIKDISSLKDFGLAAKAEQIIVVWSTLFEDSFLPCSDDESIGKDAIIVYCLSDDKMEEFISNPFEIFGPNDVKFGRNFHYWFKDGNYYLNGITDCINLDETQSDIELNSDTENDSFSTEALMN